MVLVAQPAAINKHAMPVDCKCGRRLAMKTAGCTAFVLEMQGDGLFSGRQARKREASVDQVGIAQRRLAAVLVLHGSLGLTDRQSLGTDGC
jgi:hypothetical protein